MRFSALEWSVAWGLLFLPLACGSRSALPVEDRASPNGGTGGTAPVACTADAECPAANACGSYQCKSQRCEFVAISCDDMSPCTEDSCDPTTGCDHRFLSLDMDGDKHRSPRPGYALGTDVCGDDCDDTNPNSFPGSPEICDGIDNDCDGVVDNGFSYQRSGGDPVRVSPLTAKRAQRDDGGITATPTAFIVTYTNLENRYESRLQALSSSRKRLFETQVSDVNSDTYAGAVAWSGQDVATAWSDAHTGGDYELYSRLLSPTGDKRAAALRLTDAESFSLHPSLKWNQSEYLVAFDDRRGFGGAPDGAPRVYGQRLAADGSLLGGNTVLVADPSEYPALALSPLHVGLAYSYVDDADGRSHLGFRVFDPALTQVAKAVPVGDNVDTLTLVYAKERFIALWDVSDGMTQGAAIFGAVFDEEGTILQKPQAVTTSARFARSVAAMSLGDRVLMVWGDDAETAPGAFQLYFQVLDLNLKVSSPRKRLTSTKADTLMPGLSAGPDGKIGVVYESWQDGARQVYFDTLECAATP